MEDTTTMSTPASAKGKDVSVSKASQTAEYEKSLQIVLGTVFGVLGVVVILIIGYLIYRFCCNRRQQGRTDAERNTSVHRSVSIDLEQKQVPSVLLLYSYDCCAHQKVVEALAGFLIETCNCNVHVDLFEEQIIHERGLDDWLVDNLQEAEFIIVLSSVGARLRCCKKKVRFKIDHNHTLPDYFAVAVDYVAEKMRVERSKGMPLTTFCVAYMDYSSENDIPPQLEMGFKFCLMKDITALFCHLHGIHGQPTKDGEPILGLSEDTYDTSELGTELRVAIESAKEYYKANPGWVEDRIEPVPNMNKLKSRHVRKSSLEPLLGTTETNNVLPQFVNDPCMTQTLPKLLQSPPQLPLYQTRQNSFPSSLSSHQTVPTPPLQHSSRSCDNIQPESLGTCELCGGHECCHLVVNPDNRGKQMLTTQECYSEDTVKSKSKSMPAVFRNSLYSSQTIFQAEVHKEWDDHDGRLSQADSQESGSGVDSIVDDLERDLDSIVNPVRLPTLKYSHTSYDDIVRVYTAPALSTKMMDISEVSQKRPSSYINQNIETHRDSDENNDQLHKEALHFMSSDVIENGGIGPDQIQLQPIHKYAKV